MVAEGVERRSVVNMGRDTAKTLPLLNNLRIASPCSESWDGMVGDERMRFCGGCLKNVYNLSAMTEGEAQELIADKEGDVCVRLYRRKDGTVINADCEVGVRRKRVTKIAAAALAFGGAGLALAAMQPAEEQPCDVPTQVTGAKRNRPAKLNRVSTWLSNFLGGEEPPVVEMGDISPVEPTEPTEQPHKVMMGAVAPPNPPPKDDKVPQL